MAQDCWPVLTPSPSWCTVLENGIEWGTPNIHLSNPCLKANCSSLPCHQPLSSLPSQPVPHSTESRLQPPPTTSLFFYTGCLSPFSAAHGKHWLLPCVGQGAGLLNRQCRTYLFLMSVPGKPNRWIPPSSNLAVVLQYWEDPCKAGLIFGQGRVVSSPCQGQMEAHGHERDLTTSNFLVRYCN